MITGAHFLFYSQKPEADRAFLTDILGFSSVDAGGGWLIFALPPLGRGKVVKDPHSSRSTFEKLTRLASSFRISDSRSSHMR